MTAKRGRGRPPTYKAEFARQAAKLCELGATDRELAEFFGVTDRTIGLWKVQHAEFLQALKSGKSQADDRVERSLYQRAVGYTFESEKIVTVGAKVERVAILEHVPPDTTAQIFWLKNRRPEEWRDKQSHEHSGPDGAPLIVPWTMVDRGGSKPDAV